MQIGLTRFWGPAVSVGMLAALGYVIPLPGARAACWGLALLLLVRVGISLLGRELAEGTTQQIALNAATCSLVMWLALTQTSVPFDYYRRTAGELQRMGRLEEALSTYRLAERHAPRGRSRAATIRQIQRELSRDSQHRRQQ
jgi:hypothetical protein